MQQSYKKDIIYQYYTIKAKTLKVWSVGTCAKIQAHTYQYYTIKAKTLKVWLVGTCAKIRAYIYNQLF